MSLVTIVLASAAVLLGAYFLYGSVLARLLGIDASRTTPAFALRDDVDYVPLARGSLLSQHFSAIAAAGPIVGPILAGVMFGWLPALLWIIIGSILIGGVHDMSAMFASVRHKARSVAEVVREHMTQRSYLLFLIFIWLALVYVVVAFTDITAGSFAKAVRLDDGREVPAGAIATSSLLYLALPVAMGLLMKFGRLSAGLATIIFLPLVGVAIWAGQYAPLDISRLLGGDGAGAQRFWNIALLVYCFVASVTPMWLLLQPRGHLGGYFLFIALAGGMLGALVGGKAVEYPAFRGWGTADTPLFPLLFITVACGACSGFHSMVASGTTSKQLRTEADIKPVGYGAMLMEAMVAIISLCCVMTLAVDSPDLSGPGGARPEALYAKGIGAFLAVLGVPTAFAVSFGLMAFTTFVYDTLDVCTRLGRYIVEELTGWRTAAGRMFATALTTGVPLYFLMAQPTDAAGRPAWRVFWALFGASNQLLAALTLLGVTVWLWRTRREMWVWWVTGLPAVFMYVVSGWELLRTIRRQFANGINLDAVSIVAVILVALAALMLVEAIRVLSSRALRYAEAGLSRSRAPA